MRSDAESVNFETVNPVLRACSPEIRTALMERGDLRRLSPTPCCFGRANLPARSSSCWTGSSRSTRPAAGGGVR